MKKITFAFVAISVALLSNAQNVGVGTTTPAEKLDVNGNVNVQGNLKVNGDAGQPGQVLRVNNDGTQSWANTFGYKNRKIFLFNDSWTVPAGVREVMIETIGGGGGGAKGGGGGGGGYSIGIYKVAPGSVIPITVGLWSSGSLTETGEGTDGGNSTVILPPQIFIYGYGGSGASETKPGNGGTSSVSGDSLIFAQGYMGGGGSPTVESYTQYTATEYVTMRKYGDGGASGYAPHFIQRGTFLSFNTVSLMFIKLIYGGGISGVGEKGSGGAGGNTESGRWGFDGAIGLVAISW